MKKILFILLPILFLYTNSYSQSNSIDYKKYSKYRAIQNDNIKYISEQAYWESFVKNTDKLYKYLSYVQKAADDIMVISRIIPGTGKVRLFYKNGKLIAGYAGKKLVTFYSPKKTSKTKSKNSSSEYIKQRGDKVSYISEATYYEKYLKKRFKKKKNQKIMMVSRLTPKGKRYALFYKNKKLIGQFINGKFFKE